MIIVPILLSTGFHTQVDLRRAARNSGIERIGIGSRWVRILALPL